MTTSTPTTPLTTSTPTTPSAPTREPADGSQGADAAVNVGHMERWLSLLGGGLLALATVPRSLGTVVLLGGAGALLYRGWTGHCPLYQAMGLSTASHNALPDSARRVAGPDEPALVVLAHS
jgi:uncharacterized membrane protein